MRKPPLLNFQGIVGWAAPLIGRTDCEDVLIQYHIYHIWITVKLRHKHVFYNYNWALVQTEYITP